MSEPQGRGIEWALEQLEASAQELTILAQRYPVLTPMRVKLDRVAARQRLIANAITLPAPTPQQDERESHAAGTGTDGQPAADADAGVSQP